MSTFDQWLASGTPCRLGLWQALACPYTAEICATLGYDWLLFDGEHAPNTAQTLLAQLQAVAPYPVLPIARVPIDDAAIIKQYLDLGFETLLLPMIESADQASAAVAASRFPPRGIRGVASSTSRASRFGAEQDFLATAHERVGIIVQIESVAALDRIEAIAAVPGVDALFIGPGDLAASLGHIGQPRHPAVQQAIDQAFAAITAAGKPAGIFALDSQDARVRASQGFAFVSVGTDIGLITGGGRRLLQECRSQPGA